MAQYIYHEKQESALCGQHALNMLVQGPIFNEISLSEVGLELDLLESSLSEGRRQLESENVGLFGNFSIQVLRMALEKVYDIRLVSSEAEEERGIDITQEQGFIVNRSDHWFCIRKIHDKWWNLNSTLEQPEEISQFYLTAFISQLRLDNYSVFIARGNIPVCGDYKFYANTQTLTVGVWYNISDLLGTIQLLLILFSQYLRISYLLTYVGGSGSAVEAPKFIAFQGKGNKLYSDDDTSGLSQEESDLQRAIAMSIEASETPEQKKERIRNARLAAMSRK